MNKPTLLALLLATGLTGGLARPAAAQDENKVYTYVEQMPALPGSPGQDAIRVAIGRNLRLPAADLRARTAGRIFVAFIVTATGAVTDVRIVRGLTATADAAAVRAVQLLPRLTPGRQNGRPVSVSLTLPVTVGGGSPAPSLTEPAPAITVRGNTDGAPDLSDLSGEGNRPVEEIQGDKVYTYVEQMPALPGGGGMAAIVAAIQQLLVVPANAPEGRIFVKFTVDTNGGVKDAEVVKGLSPAVDAAALTAVKKLPTFVPGKQNGRTVLVSFTLPVTIRTVQPATGAPASTKRP